MKQKKTNYVNTSFLYFYLFLVNIVTGFCHFIKMLILDICFCA